MSRPRYPRAYVMPMYIPPARRRLPAVRDALAALSTVTLMAVIVLGIVAVGGL